ncbi:MAG TPA: helix-turn-helix transcriptional regulator [Bryobacteraceae bacterium]|nr:helix-turn-helix transcriptional regulator [Bryobacteraceae bacterium]
MRSPLGIDTNALFSAATKGRSEGWHSYKLPKDALSPRELEVCQLLVEGLAVKEVAARCNVSPKTAECHTRNLYKKLRVRSRVELVRRFVQEPVIEVREAPRSSEHVQIMERLESIEASLHQLALHLNVVGSTQARVA